MNPILSRWCKIEKSDGSIEYARASIETGTITISDVQATVRREYRNGVSNNLYCEDFNKTFRMCRYILNVLTFLGTRNRYSIAIYFPNS